MSRSVDIGTEERRSKDEAIGSGKSAFKHIQGAFYNTVATLEPHLSYNLFLIYLSRVLVTILEHIIISLSF